ncbi:MAG TPA: TolC family protein [Chitinophagaceae bacterium]|nr:TolC family protein [Chitinophagaceae bacterium]
MKNKLMKNRLQGPLLFYRIGWMFITLVFSVSAIQAQELEDYIEEAIQNNPSIQAIQQEYAISTEQISEAKYLPNTQFLAGYMIGKTDMPMMQQGEFSVMQSFPWFGTTAARSQYAATMANSDYLEIEITKRKVSMWIAQSYYRLYEIQQKQKVLDDNIELLKVYERMALTSVEVGEASMVSVLRLQIRQNDLQEEKLVLDQKYIAETIIFNKLRNRHEGAEIKMVDSLVIPENSQEINVLSFDVHPEIARYEQLHQIVSQAEALNKKESAPDFGVGVEYMVFNESPNMLMPMVSLSIPIFNKKFKSITKQHQIRKEQLQTQKIAIQNDLLSQLQSAISQRNAARISIHTHDKNLKQVDHATEILLKTYETGTINFREVLDVQELGLRLQMNRVEAVSNYFKQTSVIKYFVES